MRKVKNKNGIVMYWERAKDINKINIFDSNKNYFNDLYCEIGYPQEDIKSIVKMLEITDLQGMCNFFNAMKYNSLESLCDDHEIDLNDTIDNEYINEFIVNGTKYYTMSI